VRRPTASAATRFFHELTPDRILDAVEATGLRCTGRCLALNSMENRVYDVEIDVEGDVQSPSERFRIAKFYRPGRWSRDQILAEHEFLIELREEEIPAVAPLVLADGGTLGELPDLGIHYSLFPRVGGRIRDEIDLEEARQLGRLLARMHMVGARRRAASRLVLDPATYADANLKFLLETDAIPPVYRDRYRALVEALCSRSAAWFEETVSQRIHGDCHLGNVLWGRDGAMLVDFDDMVEGACVQDVWLMTPGRDEYARSRREAILEGYEQLRDFDRRSLRLVEPLRFLRLVHFSAWIARRWEDAAFARVFSEFGSERYWAEQVEALSECMAASEEDAY